MDRETLTQAFTKDTAPEWNCPKCKNGILHLKEDTLNYDWDASTKQSKDDEHFDYNWVELVYSCFFECSNKKCQEVISSVGRGDIDHDQYYNHSGEIEQEYTEYFYPRYFYPPLNFYTIPKNTPMEIKKEILESFSLFFCSPSASANRIRVALELILNYLKIKRYKYNHNRKRYKLSLHKRID